MMDDLINKWETMRALQAINPVAKLMDGDVVIRISEVENVLEHMPSAEQEAPDINVGNIDTTTHDSIPAENGLNDGDRTSGDCISRTQAIDIAKELTITVEGYEMHNQAVVNYCAEIMQLPPTQPEPESISKWKKEFREYVDSLDIARDDWKGIIEYIDELPSAEPDTTTHGPIPVKNGRNDEDRTSGDCISRAQAIDALKEKVFHNLSDEFYGAMQVLDELPSVQPEPRTAYWTKDIVGSVVCSNCGGIREDNRIGHTQWCNCCGCFMRGEQK